MKNNQGCGNLTLETLFAEKKFNPNENQKKAIENANGPLLLTAGPGSGKTRVLLWRTLNLIVFKNVDPSEIFLATFTEKAALQLKQGLQGLLSIASKYTHKPYDIAEMYVGTLHSLCQKLLADRRFKEHSMRTKRPVVLDDLGQFLFVRDHFEELIQNAGFEYDDIRTVYEEINTWFEQKTSKGSKTNAISNCISFFNRMSEEDFGEESFKINIGDKVAKRLFKMTSCYRKMLCADGVDRVDFSNLQQRAFQFISEKKDGDSVFKYVIVDEYQDTNTIQQKIYFRLANGLKNICVVGDDDQALYRFRGATVENLVDFESLCCDALGKRPTRIDLNINYRSRKQIVKAYTDFIDAIDWTDDSNPDISYRIADKNIKAFSNDAKTAVVLESGSKESVAEKVAGFIKDLKDSGKVEDYNQCAILFPSIRGDKSGKLNTNVGAYASALEALGIKYYAPRAKNFLYTEEALVSFGLMAKIFGYNPPTKAFGNMKDFAEWAELAIATADQLIEEDSYLESFIEEKQSQIAASLKNYKILEKFCEQNSIDLANDLDVETLKKLSGISKLDSAVQNQLKRGSFVSFVKRCAEKGKPLHIRYALARVTSMDWTLLDLFYQLNSFEYFARKYTLAEQGGEDSALYNFGMITQYISNYQEIRSPIITGFTFKEKHVLNGFFGSYLYSLFCLNQSEFENSEDPFPKGCVPFLTVHQSKGLEFPVVILGSLRHNRREARPLDVLVRSMQTKLDILPKVCEPLESMDDYDTMRMFYVALSRAKNLLILSHFTGKGTSTYAPFKTLIEDNDFASVDDVDMDDIPSAKLESDEVTHVYTYTADYLPYNNCPRNYMVFHKYGFVPSRSQTMFFGSLVHQTVEDLQNFIMGSKNG